MTGEPATGGSTPSPSEGQSAAGAVLLSERRRQGLSLGDISRQLKLSVRQVEALERDDYSGYKGPVFIHGFIRNYAKLLGLDPAPLIRATDSLLNPPQIVAEVPREPERALPVHREQKRFRLWPAAVTVLVIGVVISVYFGAGRAPDAGRSVPAIAARDKAVPPSKNSVEARTGGDAKSKVEPKPEPEVAAKPATKPDATTDTKAEKKTQTAERGESVETDGTLAPESSGLVTVRMIFEQDSWVEIKDRSGNTIFGQLNPAGSRRKVSGEPPLSIVVGHAAGVRLFQGDKSIDLAPHTRVDVARLTLE